MVARAALEHGLASECRSPAAWLFASVRFGRPRARLRGAWRKKPGCTGRSWQDRGRAPESLSAESHPHRPSTRCQGGCPVHRWRNSPTRFAARRFTWLEDRAGSNPAVAAHTPDPKSRFSVQLQVIPPVTAGFGTSGRADRSPLGARYSVSRRRVSAWLYCAEHGSGEMPWVMALRYDFPSLVGC